MSTCHMQLHLSSCKLHTQATQHWQTGAAVQRCSVHPQADSSCVWDFSSRYCYRHTITHTYAHGVSISYIIKA